MLTQMSLTNFKSWQETGDIRLAPLTGFFGANSSGKSSLLQMLLMLKATTESSDRNVLLETNIKDYVELGTLHDIVHHGTDELGFSVGWELTQSVQVNELMLKNLNFSSVIIYPTTYDGKTAYIKEFSYHSDDFHASMYDRSRGSSPSWNYSMQVDVNGKMPKEAKNTSGARRPIKSYAFSPEALRYYENTPYLNDLVFALEQQFARVYHLGPIRNKTHHNYGWGGSKPSSVGIMGEDSIFALLASGDETIAKVDYWLNKMGLSASFDIKKVIGTTYQVEIKPIGSDKPVLLPDMGFGISQVLPVLVACYTVPEGSTLLIEQPEMHLHPSAQSVLADMFIEVMQQRKVQLIIESHSEHLLARLQRRMAEQKLDVNDTAFYFCRLEDGVSQIEALQLDKYGEIKNYPHDFFGDLTGDVFERAKASIEQRMGLITE